MYDNHTKFLYIFGGSGRQATAKPSEQALTVIVWKSKKELYRRKKQWVPQKTGWLLELADYLS